jgi:hypothetical protein
LTQVIVCYRCPYQFVMRWILTPTSVVVAQVGRTTPPG